MSNRSLHHIGLDLPAPGSGEIVAAGQHLQAAHGQIRNAGSTHDLPLHAAALGEVVGWAGSVASLIGDQEPPGSERRRAWDLYVDLLSTAHRNLAAAYDYPTIASTPVEAEKRLGGPTA